MTALDNCLWRFYAEARSKTGEEYSRSTLLGFRNAIEPPDQAQPFHKKLLKILSSKGATTCLSQDSKHFVKRERKISHTSRPQSQET